MREAQQPLEVKSNISDFGKGFCSLNGVTEG